MILYFKLELELALLFIVLSLLSGVGGYLQNVRHKTYENSTLHFFAELSMALVSGLFVAFIGIYKSWNPALTCALVLVASNNGADTVAFIKNELKKIRRNQ